MIRSLWHHSNEYGFNMNAIEWHQFTKPAAGGAGLRFSGTAAGAFTGVAFGLGAVSSSDGLRARTSLVDVGVGRLGVTVALWGSRSSLITDLAGDFGTFLVGGSLDVAASCEP